MFSKFIILIASLGAAAITFVVMFIAALASCGPNPDVHWCDGGNGVFFIFILPLIVFVAGVIIGLMLDHNRGH